PSALRSGGRAVGRKLIAGRPERAGAGGAAVPDGTRRGNGAGNGDASELGQLGVRRDDSFLLGAEVDEDGDFFLDADDHAEPVLVVRHLIMQGVMLDVPDWHRDVVERASG